MEWQPKTPLSISTFISVCTSITVTYWSFLSFKESIKVFLCAINKLRPSLYNSNEMVAEDLWILWLSLTIRRLYWFVFCSCSFLQQWDTLGISHWTISGKRNPRKPKNWVSQWLVYVFRKINLPLLLLLLRFYFPCFTIS